MLKYTSTRTKVLQHLQTAGQRMGDLDNCAQDRLDAARAIVEAAKQALSEILHAAGCPGEMAGVEAFLADMAGDHFHLLVQDAEEEIADPQGPDADELRNRAQDERMNARDYGVGRAA